MKSILAKSILLLVMLVGTITGLILYNRAQFFFSKIVEFAGFNWITLIVLVIASLLLTRMGLPILIKEFMGTGDFSEISSVRFLKFFVGGFIGCYVAFSLVGSILFSAYMLMRDFLS